MEHLYLKTDESDLVARIARELVDAGTQAERIRVFSLRPRQLPALPARVIRYRPPAMNMAWGTLLGVLIGALIGLPLLLFGLLDLTSFLVVVVAVGAGGALSRLWFGHGLGGELARLDPALRQGEVVMVIDVDKARLGELEHILATRYPQVAVLGTGAEGTPPFP